MRNVRVTVRVFKPFFYQAGKLGALKDFFCSVGARSKMRGVIVCAFIVLFVWCICNGVNRYCLTQADTEAIAEYLMKSGISAKS